MSTFPQPWISTTSHWQATNRGPTSLYLHNADASPPADADIVIVGGGMMGAALAYFLTREGAYGAGKRVVCLEAKDVASGASGRNGGHIGPKTYALWHQLQQPYPLGLGLDADEATRCMQNERDNLDLIEGVIRDEALDVDFWRGELLETHHSPEQTTWSKEQYAAWLAARARLGLDGDDTRFIDDAAEAERISRFKGVTSVHVRPGGSVHSHKLCTALMRLALTSPHADFQLYSWTPAAGFPTRRGSRWEVQTNKGVVSADRVILCTNAHTPNFFDEGDALHDFIQPHRAQCATITPPPTYSGPQGLRHTYNSLGGHYLVTTSTGQIVLGGGTSVAVRSGRSRVRAWVGQVDDSERGIDRGVTEDLRTYMPTHFHAWGPQGYGEGLTRTWVGILSSVKDWLPVVGEVPDKPGVSVVAGFAGHGMSRIFTTARGYATTLRTGHWDAGLLPASFQLTPARLERARAAQDAFEAESGKVVVVEGQVFRGERWVGDVVGGIVKKGWWW